MMFSVGEKVCVTHRGFPKSIATVKHVGKRKVTLDDGSGWKFDGSPWDKEASYWLRMRKVRHGDEQDIARQHEAKVKFATQIECTRWSDLPMPVLNDIARILALWEHGKRGG